MHRAHLLSTSKTHTHTHTHTRNPPNNRPSGWHPAFRLDLHWFLKRSNTDTSPATHIQTCTHTHTHTHTHTSRHTLPPLPHATPRHSNLIRLSDGHFPRQGHRFNDISYQSFIPLLPTHVKPIWLFIHQCAVNAVWLMSSRAKENTDATAKDCEVLWGFCTRTF